MKTIIAMMDACGARTPASQEYRAAKFNTAPDIDFLHWIDPTKPEKISELATLKRIDAIVASRNRLRKHLLEKTDANYFLLIDHDTTLPPGAAFKLLSHKEPVVGGLTPMRGLLQTYTAAWQDAKGTLRHYDANVLAEMSPPIYSHQAPLACLLIAREALEKVPFRMPQTEDPFVKEAGTGRMLLPSECFLFGKDLEAKAGYKILIDRNVKVIHTHD